MDELEKRIDAVVEEFTQIYITRFERQQAEQARDDAVRAAVFKGKPAKKRSR